MNDSLNCILPDNIGIQLKHYKRLMEMLYLSDTGTICKALEVVTDELKNKMATEYSLNNESSEKYKLNKNYELLIELKHSFNELEVISFITLDDN